MTVVFMVHCVYWTELTDSSSNGALCVFDGTDLQYHLWCIVCVGWK